VSDARTWLVVCDADEIEEEDVVRFDHDGASYAVYRTASGFYASDGFCTHEHAHLADGFVIGEIIECPLHQGRFHIPSGRAKSPPVCIDLETYPVRLENGKVMLGLPG
jgi:3-phenylpropionate/trans-cinnamate dioxygenase ferredoxin component